MDCKWFGTQATGAGSHRKGMFRQNCESAGICSGRLHCKKWEKIQLLTVKHHWSFCSRLQLVWTGLYCNSWWIVEDTFKTALCKKPFSIGKKVRPLLVIHIGRNKGKTRGLSTWVILASFYFKMFNGPYPASFLLYFRSFSNKHYKFYNKLMCKGPSSIQCWNSNPRPSEQQSYPVTSRPGPPPYKMIFVTVLLTKYKLTKA